MKWINVGGAENTLSTYTSQHFHLCTNREKYPAVNYKENCISLGNM